jgi:RNA 2',3'-cyclic 3'-phosphodiesterase
MDRSTSRSEPEGETLRAFIAVEVSEAVAERAGAIIERLRASEAGDVKWVQPHHFHLTLKFLGETRRADLPALSEALREVAARAAPFTLELSGVGAFPNVRRPRVVWLGASAGGEALVGLAGATETACAALGWSREEKAYHPHLTLGRVRERPRGAAGRAPAGPEALTRALEGESEAAAGDTRVERIVLVRSELQRGGPVYTVLEGFPLGVKAE